MPVEEVKYELGIAPCKGCQTIATVNKNGYCSKCVVRTSSLSNEAHVALWYALAVTQPEQWEDRWLKMKAGADAQARVERKYVFTERDWKEAIRRGLIELAERKLIMGKRDGMGVVEPTVVCADRLEEDSDTGLNLLQ